MRVIRSGPTPDNSNKPDKTIVSIAKLLRQNDCVNSETVEWRPEDLQPLIAIDLAQYCSPSLIVASGFVSPACTSYNFIHISLSLLNVSLSFWRTLHAKWLQCFFYAFFFKKNANNLRGLVLLQYLLHCLSPARTV